jgi:uroporphyrinogen decarboxylase
MVAEIERLPSPEEVVAQFDEEAEFAKALAEMRRMQDLCGPELYWCPARWEVIPNFEWYRVYGYENYLLAIALYEKHVVRLYRHSAALAGCRARVVACMVREGLHPRAMQCGQDICSNKGPMVSPAFLREHYFPLVKEAIRPLREAGAKLVWHCDGDVRPILDDILALGVGGLQGFQQECGVRLEDIVERCTLDGEKLLIFGPISVVRTLVEETPDGVKQAVRHAVQACDGKASLVLFTSNEILPDVPMQNMCALYEAIQEL